jgi:PAS domain S-box-containing protein
VESEPIDSRMRDLADSLEAGNENGGLLRALREGLADLHQKEAELDAARDALVRDREHYGELFKFAPIAYVVTDRYGLIAEVNEWAADLLGLPSDRLVGKPFATFVASADRRKFRRLLLRLSGTPGVHEFELTLESRHGMTFAAELTVATGDAGVSYDVLRFTIRDIRQRKAAEIELRALNEELEQRVAERAADAESQRRWLVGIVDQIPLALFVAEAPSGRIIMWNKAMRRIVGGDVPEIVSVEEYGTEFSRNGVPIQPEELPLARAVRNGETVPAEVMEAVRQDGSLALLEVSASPILDEHGVVIAGVAVIQDVGERERLEHAEREFVANAAHELQTPVAAITNAVEALQSGAKDDPEQRDRFLSHLQREAGRLGRLTNALLVLARAEQASEPPRLELLPLESLLREAAASIAPLPSVEITVDCAQNVGILTHRDLFLQILGSLGTNAARNTQQGRITLAARLVGDMRVTVEVSDTGTGIPLEHQDHVFRRFYRTENDGAGSGLGLAIAAQAAAALGGRLALTSTPGEGTTLTLNLPGARIVS